MGELSAELLRSLWTDLRGNQAIVDMHGHYELAPIDSGWPIALTHESLVGLVGEKLGDRAREPTWMQYHELALILREQLPNAFARTLRHDKIRGLYQQLAQATAQEARARRKKHQLVQEAVASGCRVETVASAAGLTVEEVEECIRPTPARKPPTGAVAIRPQALPAVEVVRDCWCDHRSEPAPILTVCGCLDACRHRPQVVATPASLRATAKELGLEMGERGTPTTAGYTALARHLFGLDLDTVIVLDPTTDPVTAAKADRWWISQPPPTTQERAHIVRECRPSLTQAPHRTKNAAPATTPEEPVALVNQSRGVPVMRVWSCRLNT